jgi:hypothetical protein
MTLDELQLLCDEATPGPWGSVGFAGSENGITNDPGHPSTWEDARFIAAARTYLPMLLAVAQAAASIACEDDVKDALLCHNQGMALLEALEALREAERTIK